MSFFRQSRFVLLAASLFHLPLVAQTASVAGSRGNHNAMLFDGSNQTLIPLKKIVGIFTYGPLFQAVAVLAVEWLILYWMYKRKIFLTA